jgi:uncharacterized protein (DUF2141 family)
MLTRFARLCVGVTMTVTIPLGTSERLTSWRAPAHAVALSVMATGFKNTKGKAIFALYASSEAWLKTEKALHVETVPITGDSVTVVFRDVMPGVYGASVIHDENGNGKLDMRWLPVPRPREGAGVSRDARKKFGPPSWDDAKFALSDSSYAITIKLQY